MQAEPSTSVAAQLKIPSSKLIRGNEPQMRSLGAAGLPFSRARAVTSSTHRPGLHDWRDSTAQGKDDPGTEGNSDRGEESHRDVPTPVSLWVEERH